MPQPTYIIDFDSTLITVESLGELARIALEGRSDSAEIMERVEAICARGMSGEIGFEQSLQSRLKLFSANRQHIEKLITYLRDHVSPSALTNLEWFQSHSSSIYVISGGFAEYTLPITEYLGLRSDHIFANRFAYDGNGVIIGYDQTTLIGQPQGKVKQVTALGLSGPVIVIGDGYTDYEIKVGGKADQFWAFTETISRQEVVAKADRVLRNFHDVMEEPVLMKPAYSH